ncbi:MAG: TonB-dependent receptor [Parasphingorhabdus sp.]|uniref:TonB-dependent receptor n=1 Tax=Parasphingorhabdus sp. TaxID=2709688 RepID=UPI00329942ED
MAISTTKKLMLGASGSALAIGGFAPAYAQDEAGAEDSNVIIVTANKKEESIQDVSLSIQAFDAEALDKAGITDASRLELLVSGVNYAFSGNDAKFNVRGANSNNTFADNGSIVGAYVDGVYKARASQQTRAFFDVERVEFLKGPQGTLYGRNTFAGALNLHTKKPDLTDFSAGIEVGYERFDSVKASGFINVPLGDTFAVRYAGYIQKSDGFINNLAGPDIGQQDDKGFRISALWEPTDNFNLIARLQHTAEDGREAGLFGYTFLCRNVTPSGHTDAFGSERDCANPNRGSAGLGAAANAGTPGSGPHTIAQDYVPDVNLEETVVSLEANLDLGAVSIKSISSYTDFQNLFGFDFDFGPNPHAIGGFDETLESYSQELQFNTNFDGPFNLTAGAYYSREDTFYSFSIYNQTVRDPAFPRVVAPVLDNAGNPVLDGMGNPLSLPVLTATPTVGLNRSLNGFFADSAFLDIETFGIYGQAEFEITDQLRIIGGIRYSSEKKELTGGGSNFTANGPVTVVPGTAGSSPVILPDSRDVFLINENAAGANTASRTFNNVDYKVGIEFDIADDVLLYANTATGFLSGVVNNNGSTTDQQDSQVYEIGLKSVLFDGDLTFNLAGHYTEYSNLLSQFQVIDPNTGIGVTFSENGGSIEAYGVELEAVYRPTQELTLAMNAAWQDVQFGTFGQTSPYQLNNGSTTTFVDLSGETPTFAPDLTVSLTGSYEFDLGEDFGFLTPYVQFYYSDGFGTSNLFAIDPAAFQSSYTKTDIRLVWDSPDRNYSIEAFIENIEDEAVLSRSNNNGGDDLLQSSYLYPQNYGLRLKARF